MTQYLDILQYVLDNGIEKEDRTKTGTLSLFSLQQRYDLSKGFPLLTTKKVNFKAVLHELLWFISGDTNIKYLVDRGVNIWNEWPYEVFTKHQDYAGETLKEFIQKIKDDSKFAAKHGNLGPIYGKQWRDFFGTDQLNNVVEEIKRNPDSRRLIISAWNPARLDEMLLPPCHAFMQFYVLDGKLSLQLYQRSGDMFLGIPFNIASYSLLLMMVAQVTGLEAGEFIHTIGDAHIYKNHIEQVKEQINRKPFVLPTVMINKHIKNIEDFEFRDFELIGYMSHPAIKGKVAI